MERQLSKTFRLTGAETGPHGVMPLTLLADRVIEMATMHADLLGVGHDRMEADGQAWVLSRLSIEMTGYPAHDDDYTLTTWVESFNHRFSERDFEITVGDRVIGYARTVWAAINLASRGVGNLEALSPLAEAVNDKPCPIARQGRLRGTVDGDRLSFPYTVAYRDIDFNRHVNSVAYIRLLLDAWTLDYHDRFQARRLDVAYLHEARYGDTVSLNRSAADGAVSVADITDSSGSCLTRFSVEWQPRQPAAAGGQQ
jgi:acyl-ACP thioesterase